jgi:hypothetical protein
MKAHEFIRETFELNNKISINELPNLPVPLVVELLNNYAEGKVKKLPIPDVNGSAFDEDEIYYTECPNCGRSYDEIDADYCICSKCGWDANAHKFNRGSKRNPTELDYLNGDADILTGEWS